MNKIPFIGRKTGKRRFRLELSNAQWHDLDNEHGGMCIACGELAYGIEPDACKYTCEACQAPKAYGLQELTLMGFIIITDDNEGGDNDSDL